MKEKGWSRIIARIEHLIKSIIIQVRHFLNPKEKLYYSFEIAREGI